MLMDSNSNRFPLRFLQLSILFGFHGLQALEKSKYEQSLASVRQFMAVAEKELELYYSHIAIYGDPNYRNPLSIFDRPEDEFKESVEFDMLHKKNCGSTSSHFFISRRQKMIAQLKKLSGTEVESGERRHDDEEKNIREVRSLE